MPVDAARSYTFSAGTGTDSAPDHRLLQLFCYYEPVILGRSPDALRGDSGWNYFIGFSTAEGLEPAKTRVKYRSVEIVPMAKMEEALSARVAAHMQQSGRGADFRVLIDVLRFDSAPGFSATLEAVWSVRSSAGARLREARSVFVEPVILPGVDPLVHAHGKALAALAREIAEAVAALARVK